MFLCVIVNAALSALSSCLWWPPAIILLRVKLTWTLFFSITDLNSRVEAKIGSDFVAGELICLALVTWLQEEGPDLLKVLMAYLVSYYKVFFSAAFGCLGVKLR